MLEKSLFFPQRKHGILGWQYREFAYLPCTKTALCLKIFLNLVISSNQIAQTLDVREQHCLCIWRILPLEKIFPVCSQLDVARFGSRTDDTVLFINTHTVRLNLLIYLCLLLVEFCQRIVPYICCQGWMREAPKVCALGAKLQNTFHSDVC